MQPVNDVALVRDKGHDRELACSYVTPCLRLFAERGFDVQAFCAQANLPIGRIMDESQYVSWEELCRLLQLIEERCNQDVAESVGKETMDAGILRFLQNVIPLFMSVPGAYHWGLGSTNSVFSENYPSLQSSVVDVGDGELIVEVRVRPGYRRAPVFEWVVIGQLKAMPAVFGRPHAEVQTTGLPDGIRCRVFLPPEPGVFPAVRRFVTWPYRMWKASGEIDHVHTNLQRQYRALQDEVDVRTRVEAELRAEIEARREAEALRLTAVQQLQRVQRLESIGTLAGGVAHDFNNLLVIIMGNAELAELAKDSEARSKHLNQLLNAAEKAGVLTQQLLTFSRQNVAQKMLVDLNAVVDDMHQMLVRLVPASVALERIVTSEPGTVFADGSLLGQVVMNLVVNARDAMPEGGRLLIETSQVELDGEAAAAEPWAKPGLFSVLSVSDSGEGIPESVQARIFEPFFTTKSEGEGTGLGLSVVFGIVEQHDGFLHVYSEKDLGTTIRVFLPVVEQEPDVTPAEIKKPPRGGQERILVADDNEGVRDLAVHMLQHAGYDVHIAVDGQQAIDMINAESEPYQLALLDVVMPYATGNQVRDVLLDKWPACSVLFVTGYAAHDRNKLALKPGVELLAKPYGSSELLRRIRALLDD